MLNNDLLTYFPPPPALDSDLSAEEKEKLNE